VFADDFCRRVEPVGAYGGRGRRSYSAEVFKLHSVEENGGEKKKR